jgi:opacity protein-like surface antigen
MQKNVRRLSIVGSAVLSASIGSIALADQAAHQDSAAPYVRCETIYPKALPNKNSVTHKPHLAQHHATQPVLHNHGAHTTNHPPIHSNQHPHLEKPIRDAHPKNSQKSEKNNHYYVGAQAGASYNLIRHQELVPIAAGGYDQGYNATGGTNVVGDFGLRAGFIKVLNDRTYLEMGPSFSATTNQNLTGTYLQDGGTTPDLFLNYHLQTQRIMGEGRVYYHVAKHASLFAGGGLGIAMIHTTAANFTANPSATVGIIQPPTKALTTHQTAYALSGGVSIPMNSSVHLDFGINQLWMGNLNIAVNTSANPTGSYSNIKMGSLHPTTFWTELGFNF